MIIAIQLLLQEFKIYIPQRISEMKAALKNFSMSCFQNFYSLRTLSTNESLGGQPVADTDDNGVKLVVSGWQPNPHPGPCLLMFCPPPPSFPQPKLPINPDPHHNKRKQ